MNPNSETPTAKKFSFWFQNKLRERIEALGFAPARFINEAIIEKLAREEYPTVGGAGGLEGVQTVYIHEAKPLKGDKSKLKMKRV